MAGRRHRPAAGSSLQGVRPSGAERPATRPAASGRKELPPFTRPALAPSLIAACVLLACVAIIDADAFVFARWGVTVLALIVLVFAVRGRVWWAVLVSAAIAVLWNPLVTIPLPGQLWAALQLAAAAAFIVLGILVKVPRETEPHRTSGPSEAERDRPSGR